MLFPDRRSFVAEVRSKLQLCFIFKVPIDCDRALPVLRDLASGYAGFSKMRDDCALSDCE